MKENTIKLIAVGVAILTFAAIWLISFAGIGKLGAADSSKATERVREALEQAVMQCYALEGAYPPDLEYLADHYGLIVDRERYLFLYEVIGDNVHPIIDVVRLEDFAQ